MRHGFVSSCIGPVVDIVVFEGLFSYEQIFIASFSFSFYLNLNLYSMCIYDSVVLLKLSTFLRRGFSVPNNLGGLNSFMSFILYTDSLILFFGRFWISKLFCNKGEFFYFSDILFSEFNYLFQLDLLVGFGVLYTVVRAYFNLVTCEISQLCTGGIIRCVSFGLTEGINSSGTGSLFSNQPVVMPSGRSSLGRIFNVTGASLDFYLDNSISVAFLKGCLKHLVDMITFLLLFDLGLVGVYLKEFNLV